MGGGGVGARAGRGRERPALRLSLGVRAVKRKNRRRVQQVVGPDFDDEGAAELVGDLGGLVEAVAAVEAFGEGVVNGEADIGGGVCLGLLHDPEIAALPNRKQRQKKGRPKAAPCPVTGKLAEGFATRRQVAGRGAVGEGLQVTAGEAGCCDDDMGQAPVKRQECPLCGLGGRLLILLVYNHSCCLKRCQSRPNWR